MSRRNKSLDVSTSKSSITISQEEYEELLDRSLLLYFLEAAGVDKWEGYEEAMESYHEFLNNGQE